MPNPSSVAELYPSKWIRAADLAGRAATVKITAVTVETFRQPDGSSKSSAVLAFDGKVKRMILNRTQCQALADLTGSDLFADWVGRVIVLTTATAQNGKPTIAIRPAPAQGASRSASEPARTGAGV